MTISEMAKKLKVPRKTVEMRILRGGHKPLTKEAVYSADVFEAIKESPGRGRPPKAKPEAADKPGKPEK